MKYDTANAKRCVNTFIESLHRCGMMQVLRCFSLTPFVRESWQLWEATTNTTITVTGQHPHTRSIAPLWALSVSLCLLQGLLCTVLSEQCHQHLCWLCCFLSAGIHGARLGHSHRGDNGSWYVDSSTQWLMYLVGLLWRPESDGCEQHVHKMALFALGLLCEGLEI